MSTIDLLTESGFQILVESGAHHLIVRHQQQTPGGGGSKFARGARPPAPVMSKYASRGAVTGGNVGYRKVRLKKLVTVNVMFDDEETSFSVDMNTRENQPTVKIESALQGNNVVVELIQPTASVKFFGDDE